MTQHYHAETIKLHWPITDDKGQPLTQLTLQMVSHLDHVRVIEESDDNEEQAFVKFAHLACGLSHSEIKRLKMPDWNSIRLKLTELVTNGSDHFITQPDGDSAWLLVPINGDDDSLIEQIELQIPSVETTEIMQKQATLEDKNLFITMSCTGLTKGEIAQLSAPDWNYLQGRISNFLNETADFFRGKISQH